MTASFYLRSVLRESRGQGVKLAFFVACLGVGVAAVVAVAGLAASLSQAIRSDAKKLLAADFVVSTRSSRPLPAELGAALAAIPRAETTEVRELLTIVAARPASGSAVPGRSRLAELKAVGQGYPFYGQVEVEPARPLAELLAGRQALVEPALLTSLGLATGDELRIGTAWFKIAGTVRSEPDRIGGAFSAGPRVLISLPDLGDTELEGRGSQVEKRLLFRLGAATSKEELNALAARLRELAGDNVRIETYTQGQPAIRRGLDRAERFLGLVALLSLLAGGIGVAQTVRSWLAGKLDAIAVLKCLGMRPREVVGLYVGQTAGFALLGSLGGVAAGLAVELAVPRVLGDLVPAAAVDPWQLAPILRGIGLGLGVALLFCLPPLLNLRRVPPSRVLRREAEPPPASRPVMLATLAALAAGVLALALVQSGSPARALGFTGGLALAAGLLAGAAWLLTRLAARLRRGPSERGFTLSYGLAALARPGASTLGAIVALGLGVLVVLAMALVERHLVDRLQADLPKNAPTAFLIDIQPDQWPGVESLLLAEGAERLDSVPVVTARITELDGTATRDLAKRAGDRGDRRWALTREQRLTYLERLPADNRVVEGALWSLPGEAEVSVERDFAHDLGIHLGSKLVFDIQGVPLTLTVSSLRTVDWDTFGINFFLVVEPGVLEGAPQQRVAAARLAAGSEEQAQDALVDRFPNVTLINIRTILDKVAAVIERIALGIRLLGGFTVAAGIAILAGVIAAGSARRGREVALLKTLGLTRAGVVGVFAVEYALIGLAAGTIGTTGGAVLAWVVLTEGMEIPWRFLPAPLLIAAAGTIALAVACGLLASAGALTRRPLAVLRAEG